MQPQAKRWDDWAKRQDSSKHVGEGRWKEEQFIFLLKEHASKEKEALEIGCGSGRIAVQIAPFFKHVYATDPSPEMLRRGGELVTSSNISFHLIDGYTLKEFKDASIDVVYSHEVFHLLTIYQDYSYFKEIKRILKDGGIAIISLYNFAAPYTFETYKRKSLELWEKQLMPTISHSHFITREMIYIMLADLELKVLEMRQGKFLKVVFVKEKK